MRSEPNGTLKRTPCAASANLSAKFCERLSHRKTRKRCPRLQKELETRFFTYFLLRANLFVSGAFIWLADNVTGPTCVVAIFFGYAAPVFPQRRERGSRQAARLQLKVAARISSS